MITGLIGITIVVAAVIIYVVTTRFRGDDRVPVVQAVRSEKPRLVFSDEFNGSTLDSSKWNTCYDSYLPAFGGCTNHGNFESEWYTSKQVSVKEGNLVLEASKERTRGATRDGQEHYYDWTSGMVTTGRYLKDTPAKWTANSGYFEARMKVPSGKGVWPAFWLLPVDHDWPPEIDIMELLGDKPNEVLTTYHWKGEEGKGVPQDSSLYSSPNIISDSWHVFALNWSPGVLDWYIDGKNVKHFANSAVTNKPMQIILNLAVGGTLPGYPDNTTPDKATMQVDYVRVYENK